MKTWDPGSQVVYIRCPWTIQIKQKTMRRSHVSNCQSGTINVGNTVLNVIYVYSRGHCYGPGHVSSTSLEEYWGEVKVKM